MPTPSEAEARLNQRFLYCNTWLSLRQILADKSLADHQRTLRALSLPINYVTVKARRSHLTPPGGGQQTRSAG